MGDFGEVFVTSLNPFSRRETYVLPKKNKLSK
jgi:hypothetical protein